MLSKVKSVLNHPISQGAAGTVAGIGLIELGKLGYNKGRDFLANRKKSSGKSAKPQARKAG